MSALPANWTGVVAAARPEHERIANTLTDSGLLMNGQQRLWLRIAQAAPFAALFTFGIDRWMLGDARDKPVGWLTMLLVLTAFIALVRFASCDGRTSAGKSAINDAARVSDRLRRAPTEPEMDRAVALFGTSVLALSAYGQFHRFRNPPGDGGSGSSDSGSNSNSDGGGGCGGCGGD
jgi:uncharacterized protein (TIGR04222 family)